MSIVSPLNGGIAVNLQAGCAGPACDKRKQKQEERYVQLEKFLCFPDIFFLDISGDTSIVSHTYLLFISETDFREISNRQVYSLPDL